ncbi:PBECR2 nuclease fold domain-containing protein [Candidatus Tokpelaia sp.]|uniref:PBECR2 nuclease fold domain-containing protein n=1 Tax=Candidatus Tokpelaia sp. TaxID=2233777 RepID=UPI00123A3901|nr:PBECR2 nuclease fold domain-containing protein [Candidatus Tokpelaia sp.]KAA6405954.1 hypothetical protein DPQ22_02035 [Candidatus Tokpelaia sp.]
MKSSTAASALAKAGCYLPLKCRYVRFDPIRAVFSAFSWGSTGWSGNTLFSTKGNKEKDERYIERQQHGALLYRRKK